MPDSFFEEPRASELEAMGEKARKKRGRIAFDCYNTIYPARGNRVKCRLGHSMGLHKGGTMDLESVMAGRTGSGCRRCPDFDGEQTVE